jgi:hypothetical protein
MIYLTQKNEAERLLALSRVGETEVEEGCRAVRCPDDQDYRQSLAYADVRGCNFVYL